MPRRAPLVAFLAYSLRCFCFTFLSWSSGRCRPAPARSALGNFLDIREHIRPGLVLARPHDGVQVCLVRHMGLADALRLQSASAVAPEPPLSVLLTMLDSRARDIMIGRPWLSLSVCSYRGRLLHSRAPCLVVTNIL